MGLTGGGHSRAGRRAYWVWSGDKWAFICLELQWDTINCTYEGGEKDHTKHDAVTALMTCS